MKFRTYRPETREVLAVVCRFSVIGLFLACAALMAQITLSTVRGTAADPTGAVVVNADITLVGLDNGVKRVVKTDQNGNFEFPDLPRGVYRLTANAAGFKTFVADNILLESSQIRRINPSLELGAVGSEVTVTAGAALISTDSAKLQGAVNVVKHFDNPWVSAEANLDHSLYITSLPLVQQAGGVWGTTMAGQSSSQVQMGQDGHTNDGAVNQLNDIMDTQEITVVSVNNTAEFARVGYMNLVTKGGSNEFHGRAAYWNQNSALGAREFFESEKAKVLIHTISTGVSGPIRKDKTFFYASANILKVPSKMFYLLTVPTAKMRSGDFSQLLTLARPTTVRDPFNNTPFPGNVVPASRLSGVSQKVNEKYLPAPNVGGPDALSNNYGYTFPFPSDYSLRVDMSQRIDHQITQNNRLMGRVVENWDNYVLPSSYETFAWTRRRDNHHIVIEDTHVFSPNLVNTFRWGVYHEKITDGVTLYGVTPFKGDEAVKAIGLQGVNPSNLSAQGFPSMAISGYTTLSMQPGGVVQNDYNYGYADTMTWSKGRHVFKFGGEFKPQHRFTGNVPTGTYGSFSFNGSLSGYGYSDFMLGLPYTATRLDPLTLRDRSDYEFGLFITDDLKVNSRVTLNVGLRWDRFGSPSFDDGLMWNWDMSSGSILIPAGMESKVRPLYPKTIPIKTGQVAQNPDNGNFAPRIGVAWRPFGENTVIRGGYGLYTETLGRYSRLNTGGPFEISESYNNVIQNGVPLFSFPNPFPSSLASANVPSQSFTGYPLESKNGQIHQFNLTVERQVKDIGLRLSYVGSRGRNLNYSIGINKPQASTTPFSQSRRPWPLFVGGSYYRNNGATNYNALSLQAERKLGSLTFNTHWSLASNYNNTANLQDPYAPLGWSRDQYTTRQRAVVNAVWEVPVGKGRKYMSNAPAIANYVLGGWQIYWMAYFETGWFFSPSFSGSDPSGTNSVGGIPDRICNGNLPAGQRTMNRWFDASCFVAPPAGAGRYGNSGAYVLEGPGYHMHHISLAKSFNLTERFKFTLTAAGSNAFNHPNLARPASNISATNVGVINNLREGGRGRHIELRGRIDF